jgi:hypothetical protein
VIFEAIFDAMLAFRKAYFFAPEPGGLECTGYQDSDELMQIREDEAKSVND